MAEILNCFPLTVFKEKAGLDPAFRKRVGTLILDAHSTGPKGRREPYQRLDR